MLNWWFGARWFRILGGGVTKKTPFMFGSRPQTSNHHPSIVASGDEAILPLSAVCNTYREWCPRPKTWFWRFGPDDVYNIDMIFVYTYIYIFTYTEYLDLNSVFIHLKQTACKTVKRPPRKRPDTTRGQRGSRWMFPPDHVLFSTDPLNMLVSKCRPEVNMHRRFLVKSWLKPLVSN